MEGTNPSPPPPPPVDAHMTGEPPTVVVTSPSSVKRRLTSPSLVQSASLAASSSRPPPLTADTRWNATDGEWVDWDDGHVPEDLWSLPAQHHQNDETPPSTTTPRRPTRLANYRWFDQQRQATSTSTNPSTAPATLPRVRVADDVVDPHLVQAIYESTTAPAAPTNTTSSLPPPPQPLAPQSNKQPLCWGTYVTLDEIQRWDSEPQPKNLHHRHGDAETFHKSDDAYRHSLAIEAAHQFWRLASTNVQDEEWSSSNHGTVRTYIPTDAESPGTTWSTTNNRRPVDAAPVFVVFGGTSRIANQVFSCFEVSWQITKKESAG